jgi:REP element-mobilizing transposase RayT
MRKSKQLSFIKPTRKFFGGALLHGKRKSIRPLSSKEAIHFVLRSQWAMGPDSFLAVRNRKAIERIIRRFALRFGVRVYRQSINSNHIHLLLRITNRLLYRAFIKAVSGKIASQVMGQQSFKLFRQSRLTGKQLLPMTKKARRVAVRYAKATVSESAMNSESVTNLEAGDGAKGFWQFRPFSRVVHWGNDFKTCTKYLKQNVLEAFGFAPYKPRKNFYRRWLNETLSDLNLRIAINLKN